MDTPPPRARACFGPDLVESLFTMTAAEARARSTHQALTPVIDVARKPRWGRVEETFGEDPFRLMVGMSSRDSDLQTVTPRVRRQEGRNRPPR
jgi:beta-glucosidase-like glycosyl hydrolase